MDLVTATLEARKRTGDRSIGTQVKQGMFRVVRVTYGPKGRGTVEPLSEYSTMRDTIAKLASL
jgi:hypothetical protein